MRRNPHRYDFYCFSLYFYCRTICCRSYCGYEEAEILMKFIRTGICNLCKYYVTFSSSASYSLIKSHYALLPHFLHTLFFIFFWSCRDDIYLIGNVSTRTRFSNVTNGLSLVEFTATIASFLFSLSLLLSFSYGCNDKKLFVPLSFLSHREKSLKAVCFFPWGKCSVIFIDLNLNEINKEYFRYWDKKELGECPKIIWSDLQGKKNIITLFSWK